MIERGWTLSGSFITWLQGSQFLSRSLGRECPTMPIRRSISSVIAVRILDLTFIRSYTDQLSKPPDYTFKWSSYRIRTNIVWRTKKKGFALVISSVVGNTICLPKWTLKWSSVSIHRLLLYYYPPVQEFFN